MQIYREKKRNKKRTRVKKRKKNRPDTMIPLKARLVKTFNWNNLRLKVFTNIPFVNPFSCNFVKCKNLRVKKRADLLNNQGGECCELGCELRGKKWVKWGKRDNGYDPGNRQPSMRNLLLSGKWKNFPFLVFRVIKRDDNFKVSPLYLPPTFFSHLFCINVIYGSSKGVLINTPFAWGWKFNFAF